MPLLNPETGDAITSVDMTTMINRVEFQPRQFAEKGWNEQGVLIPHVLIDRNATRLDIVEASTYNGPAGQTTVPEGHTISLFIPSYPDIGTIRPDEVAGRRQLGSTMALEMPADRLQTVLSAQARKFDLTWEVTRIQAVVFGKQVNRLGNTVVDLQAQFGMGPTQLVFDFTAGNADLPAAIVKWKRTLEDKLGDFVVAAWDIECDGAMFDLFVNHPSVRKAYERYKTDYARGDHRKGFEIVEGVFIKEYRNATLGEKVMPNGVKASAKKIFPVGLAAMTPRADGFYNTRFAPKQGLSTVHTVGLPIYVSTKDLDHDMGVENRVESNFVHYVSIPEGVGVITQGNP